MRGDGRTYSGLVALAALIIVLAVTGYGLVTLADLDRGRGIGGNIPTFGDRDIKKVSAASSRGEPLDHWYIRLRIIKSHGDQTRHEGVLLLGDSIVEGISAGSVCGLPVVNGGVAAMGVSFFSANIDGLLSLYKPSFVVVSAGINDAAKQVSATDEAYLAHWAKEYSHMLERITAVGAIPIVMTILPVEAKDGTGAIYFNNGVVRAINGRLRDLVARRSGVLIDSYTEFVDSEGFMKQGMTIDGVHLNGEAYRKFKSLIRQGLLIAAAKTHRTINCAEPS